MTEPHAQPERIDLAQADDRRDVVHRAVACLAQGGIVGLATETVYGLAASALNVEAVRTLRRLRQEEDNQPLTLLVKGAVEVGDWVPNLGDLGRRLAQRAWPGPVALHFANPGSGGLAYHLPQEVRPLLFPDGTIALRSPAHPFVREVLRLLPAPLVLTHAVGPDNRAATSADALTSIPGVAMIVDDGPTRYRGVSTSVRVDGDRWSIVRQGVVDATYLTRMAGTILLFVCTGNTCRSPMAAALCRTLLARRKGCAPEELEDRGLVIVSAGIATSNGMPAAAHAVEVVRARGGSLEQHASRQLSLEMVRCADHVIAMTSDHLEALIDLAPECAPRARLLHSLGEDIADPVGSDRETYLRTARAIEQHLETLLDDLGL